MASESILQGNRSFGPWIYWLYCSLTVVVEMVIQSLYQHFQLLLLHHITKIYQVFQLNPFQMYLFTQSLAYTLKREEIKLYFIKTFLVLVFWEYKFTSNWRVNHQEFFQINSFIIVAVFQLNLFNVTYAINTLEHFNFFLY